MASAASAHEVPDYKCTLKADERSRLFKPGYRLPDKMTYEELCTYVSQESNKAGFDPLRPRILNKSRTLDYVNFYCVHARNHGNQSREAMRQLMCYTKCKVKKIEIRIESDLVYSAIAVLFKEGEQSERRQGCRVRPGEPLEPARGGE
jgi:hypothetical protein